ncbi:dead box atp-dependent rna helicase i-like protein [Dermatophagoides farinae]|uniref:Dead box atp-dependent rna helicase i-like protein n=1 Tax=Dermatophagoides farinae TaxID=6954 RepID=A0A9D4NSC8_DERFA|nr:uncharacterized protein LOC124495121 [Dermatophagoides farinae]KAH7637354.1 dead box atp-dependent rna helicase i-like protein [Dermatophagoides farinae]
MENYRKKLRSTPSRLAYQRAKSTMCSTPIVEQMKNKTPKRKLDKNNDIVKSMHAMRRGEISSTNCCSLEFRNYRTLYQHIVAVHPNFFVDNSIPQDESPEKNLKTSRSTPSRLAYLSNQRAKSTACMEKKSSPMCSTLIGNKPKDKFVMKTIMEKTHSLNNNTISLVGNSKNATIQHSNKRTGMNQSNLQQIDTNQQRHSLENNNDELIMAQHDAQKTNTKTVSLPIDNHDTNLSNQQSSNGKKIFYQHVNCSPHIQSSSIELMNGSSQALVNSNNANSSIDHIRSMLRNHEIGQIYKNYDFQYNCIDSLVKTLKDKESSTRALVLLTKKVKSVFKDCLLPLNDKFHPLFLFDKDVNVYFEFTINDPKSLFDINERLSCSDWRILRHSKLIYAFVYEYCQTISK